VTDTLRYDVDLTDRLHHLVRVSLTVPAELSAGARVVLPVWTPGSYVVRDYARHVQWLRASDSAGDQVPVSRDGVNAWRLPDDVDGEVVVDLELYANDLSVRTNHVDDHHALLIPAATFPTVAGAEDRPHEVHLPAPDGQRVWSLLPEAEPDRYRADDHDHLVDSAFEVGDLPHIEFEVAGVPHAFVWAGHGGRPDLDRIARDTAAIAEAAIALFGGELPIDRYTLLCAGWDEGGGGLEHRDGAVLQMPVRTFQDEDLTARFQSLIAHEYLHLWNVKRLVPRSLVRPDHGGPTHSESLWVAEGWTAYYDELLPLRAGIWTPSRHLDVLRDTWQRLLDTPGARIQSLRQASYEAWIKHYLRDENTPNVATDYYGHGSLVAWELDLLLRRSAPDRDGLDDVLRLLWERHAGSDDGYTEADVLDAVAEVGDDDLAGLVDRRVGACELPDLEAAVGAVGLRVATDDASAAPDLGVATAESDAGVTFTSVFRDRPAWQAGLTGGDRLVALDGTTVGRGQLRTALADRSPDDEVEVTVLRGPRVLTRTVRLDAPRPRRRFVRIDAPDDAQREAFRRWTGRAIEEAPGS
jgi:predicted metalloprotease with PDZ domain